MATEVSSWKFRTAHDGRWMWQGLSGEGQIISQSELAFAAIEDCAVDAQRCGYAGVIADYAARD